MKGVRLFVASAGNAVMHEIAALFAEGLQAEGIACETVIDGIPQTSASDWHQVVVAPHEYFPLYFVRHMPTIRLAPTLEHVWMLTVEQPGSHWFEVAHGYARRARGVMDISADGVREFGRRGVPAVHVPLGTGPSLRAPVVPPAAERPVDLLFVGHNSPRRDAFFARHAAFFSARDCRIVLTEVERPRTPDTSGYQGGAALASLVASSRIVLNVHSTERQYFEQHRALLALANECLLVTETSRHTAPLVSGEHFAMAPLDELPALCDRYLASPGELSAVARAGHDLARERLHIRHSCRIMLDALAAPPIALAGGSSAELNVDEDRDAVRARLRQSGDRRNRGEPLWTVTQNEAGAASAPAISVVVTVFNYVSYIAQCLASVAAARPIAGGVELVVVDDGSTDGSQDAITAFMAATPLPVRFVRKELNTGLADARNAGLECARAPAVFVLDADNWLYPDGLRVLHEALAAGGYAAAYGLIARFEEETGEAVGLISPYAWSVRDLVRAPYIDAMALLDREAVLAVGGYSTELIEHGWFGWEDYDLWLKLAQAGRSCLHVPRIVAGYREHARSMLQRTNRSSAQLSSHLHTKFRDLADRFADLDMLFGFPVGARLDESEEAREIRALRAHVAQLEQRIAEIQSSASWTLTAPLRRLGASLLPKRDA